MPCPRPVAVALLLLPCLACTSNTIELETMAGSSSATEDDTASDDATVGSATATVTTTVTSTTTVTTTTATVTTMGPGPVSLDDVTGPRLDIGVEPGDQTLLLAVDTIISPGLPLQGIVWLESNGGGTIDLALQWLSLDQGSTTEPRELVGDVYAYSAIPVSPDGSFTWETGVVLIPGAANPITGSDIVASVVAEVVPQGSPYCGRVGGEVTSPINVPLDGSTHAMTAVASELELPLEFPVTCP
jgi:hypothetical protein